MYCLLIVFARGSSDRRSKTLAPKEGQEPDLPEIEPSCYKSFDEGKFILPLMHKILILSLPLPKLGSLDGYYAFVR
jgi:hypothetical protein